MTRRNKKEPKPILPHVKRRRRKMQSTLELSLNYQQIEDTIAAHLHAIRAVPINVDIKEIFFGDIDDKGLVKLTLHIEKDAIIRPKEIQMDTEVTNN